MLRKLRRFFCRSSITHAGLVARFRELADFQIRLYDVSVQEGCPEKWREDLAEYLLLVIELLDEEFNEEELATLVPRSYARGMEFGFEECAG